ncbi:MAG: hypothetical protein ACRCWQ_11320 [Bacilli bacterium]
MGQFQFKFDRCFKVFSDTYVMDWFNLFAPDISRNYELVDFEQRSSFASRLAEEFLPEIPANKGAIVDRLYILQRKNDPTKKILFHIEFESTLSSEDYQKLLTYFYRIKSAVTDMPSIHLVVLAPGIAIQDGVLEPISWQTYRDANVFPHCPIPYFPLYMEDFHDSIFSNHQKALWFLLNWAVRRRGDFKEKVDLHVCKGIWLEILGLYYGEQHPSASIVLFQCMCGLFGLESPDYIALAKEMFVNYGGEKVSMYSMYSVLSKEEHAYYEEKLEKQRVDYEHKIEMMKNAYEAKIQEQATKIQQQETKIQQQETKIQQQEAKIQQQEAKIQQQEAKIHELEVLILKLEARIEMLLQRVEELESK